MNPEYDYCLNMHLIGDAGVGKSCFLLRFTDDTFIESHKSTTVGLRIRTIEVDGKVIKLQIWDFAGKAHWSKIISSYCGEHHAYIIAYDVTSRESFNSIKRWLPAMDPHNNHEKMLVGNKNDLTSKKVVNSVVAREFAKQLSMPSLETSAKDSKASVTLVFGTILKLFVGRMRSLEMDPRPCSTLVRREHTLREAYEKHTPASPQRSDAGTAKEDPKLHATASRHKSTPKLSSFCFLPGLANACHPFPGNDDPRWSTEELRRASAEEGILKALMNFDDLELEGNLLSKQRFELDTDELNDLMYTHKALSMSIETLRKKNTFLERLKAANVGGQETVEQVVEALKMAKTTLEGLEENWNTEFMCPKRYSNRDYRNLKASLSQELVPLVLESLREDLQTNVPSPYHEADEELAEAIRNGLSELKGRYEPEARRKGSELEKLRCQVKIQVSELKVIHARFEEMLESGEKLGSNPSPARFGTADD